MPAMSDFSCNVKENIKRLETSLNVERNFDILQREVMIAGHRAGFFFIDGQGRYGRKAYAVFLFIERIGHGEP